MKRAQLELPAAAATQRRYAVILLWGTRAGLALLVAGFGLYAFGVVAPHVAFEHMPRLWNQPVDAYLRATGQSTGWTWVALVSRSDIFNLIGISVLSGWSAVCLLAVIPLYAAQRDWPFVVLCAAEVAVLVLAASNVLAFGH